MIISRKALKSFSTALTAFFLLFALLIATHFHSETGLEKLHSCSICQLSHSTDKVLPKQNSLQTFIPTWAETLQVQDPGIHLSEIKSYTTIRGPPPLA